MQTSWDESSEHLPYLDSVSEKLKEFVHDGLLSSTNHSCTVSEEGRAFLRNICMAFDARLARKAPDTKLFSQTV
jgi:oxygen-independent coproporphyrinogen-3 oxidase